MIALDARKPETVETALCAVAATSTLDEAVELAREQGLHTTRENLRVFALKRPEDLARIRERMAPQLEKRLTGGMLDNAIRLQEAERVATERTLELLNENRIADPSRVLRDLAQAKSQTIDKRMSLEGRPQVVTETRNVDELINALVGLRVATRVDAEGTAVEIEG